MAQPPPPLRCLFSSIFLLCCKYHRVTFINTLLTDELGFRIPAYCPPPDKLALVEKPRSRHVRPSHSFCANGPYRPVTPRAMFRNCFCIRREGAHADMMHVFIRDTNSKYVIGYHFTVSISLLLTLRFLGYPFSLWVTDIVRECRMYLGHHTRPRKSLQDSNDVNQVGFSQPSPTSRSKVGGASNQPIDINTDSEGRGRGQL